MSEQHQQQEQEQQQQQEEEYHHHQLHEEEGEVVATSASAVVVEEEEQHEKEEHLSKAIGEEKEETKEEEEKEEEAKDKENKEEKEETEEKNEKEEETTTPTEPENVKEEIKKEDEAREEEEDIKEVTKVDEAKKEEKEEENKEEINEVAKNDEEKENTSEEVKEKVNEEENTTTTITAIETLPPENTDKKVESPKPTVIQPKELQYPAHLNLTTQPPPSPTKKKVTILKTDSNKPDFVVFNNKNEGDIKVNFDTCAPVKSKQTIASKFTGKTAPVTATPVPKEKLIACGSECMCYKRKSIIKILKSGNIKSSNGVVQKIDSVNFFDVSHAGSRQGITFDTVCCTSTIANTITFFVVKSEPDSQIK